MNWNDINEVGPIDLSCFGKEVERELPAELLSPEDMLSVQEEQRKLETKEELGGFFNAPFVIISALAWTAVLIVLTL
jgi:hypothetical protein